MLVELGHFALILSFLVAIVQTVAPIAGAQAANRAWMAVATPAMLPVPTVAASAVISAWKWETSPSAPGSVRLTSASHRD